MNYGEHRNMIDCQQRLLGVLKKEMDRRPDSAGIEWVEKERCALQQAAYQWAVRRHLDVRPTLYDIERLEHFAIGHVDYASKLCLYVAEFLYGQRMIHP